MKEEVSKQIEKEVKEKMQEAYLQGLTVGMKTACTVILEILENNKNLNPQKRLGMVKTKIMSLLQPPIKNDSEEKEENE